jgi:glycosyltransferase involved in cell wall biosynthesis
MCKSRLKNTAFISTVPHLFETQLSPLLSSLSNEGWKVTCLCDGKLAINGVAHKKIKIKRKIEVLNDLGSLLQLSYIFLTSNYQIIHTYSPKGGLLGQLAAFVTFKNHRIHTFTGQVWYTKSGFERYLLKKIDKLIGMLATECFCDSFSQKSFLIDQGVIKKSKIKVLGSGSLCGVDLKRFKCQSVPPDLIFDSSNTSPTQQNTATILFVGRVCEDKGLKILLKAFELLDDGLINLIIAGEIEEDADFYLNEFKRLSINYLGNVKNIEDVYRSADILVLPSKREGFGTVVIEANACGVVAIGSNIPGLSDSIQDSITGILIDDVDPIKLCSAIIDLVGNKTQLAVFKKNALSRVRLQFDSKSLVSHWMGVYKLCLEP